MDDVLWLSVEEFVRRRRALDIVLAPAVSGADFRLHCEFDGYGDFFSIEPRDVQYVDIVGQFSLGGMLRVDARELGGIAAKWQHQSQECEGHAVVFWDAYAESLKSAADYQKYVVVADAFDLVRGVNWED